MKLIFLSVTLTLVSATSLRPAHVNENPTVACTGTLPPFDDVRKGEITGNIILAKDFYLDPRNNFGSLERRRAKLDSVTRRVFLAFIDKRGQEYRAVKCHYRGVDWNQAGNSSWRTMTCPAGFAFVPSTLVRTTNGDWKGGPNWGANYSSISWKTGGYRRSETFAEIDAVYANIDEKIRAELNSARQVLTDRGIPTTLP